MKMRSAILLAAVALAAPLFAAPKAPRPNILYLYVDDMGWGSIGPNGQAERRAKGLPHVLTPNLDRLAAAGVNFTRSYGCTVCSPARSSQQSGFHQGHTFADRNDPDNAKKAMRADEILMGDALSQAGYTTGYWGKWGYGGSKSQPAPEIVNVQTLPTSHGYRHVVAELHHVRAHTFFQPTLWNAPAKPGAAGGLELKPNSLARLIGNPSYPDEPALQNHPAYPANAYCDDVYCFAALDFVRAGALANHADGTPFFGLLAVQVPHAPFGEIEKLPEWDRAYRDKPFFASLPEQAKQWAAMVTRIDGHFGNILAALEDPNGDGDTSDSVADNTLVVFQSDNGGPQHPARDAFRANGGLRASKGKIEEGGIRIPTIMRWPAKITSDSPFKAGTDTDRVLDVSDLLPTFCELAGIPAPLGVDGVSIAPTLTGEGSQRRREFLIHEAGNGQSIVRGRHKLIRRKKGVELYDLVSDPAETKDLASGRPELVRELEVLLLGERVTEPRGFAATYHRWTGGDGAQTSDSDNWSDYVYANAGRTYLTDTGAPRPSWIALMENPAGSPARAVADTDLEFLGLEIRGGKTPKALQQLDLGKGINLTGRNEIRLSARAQLTVNGGRVSTLRWLEIAPGATLSGRGSVIGDVFQDGTISTDGTLRLVGNLRASGSSGLIVALNGADGAAVSVDGEAHLAGMLKVRLSATSGSAVGGPLTVLTANRIEGRFENETCVAADGARFKIRYTATSVTLTPIRDR